MVKVDVAQFKMINEMFNFKVGDEVIKRMTTLLRERFDDPSRAFARLGADEFILFEPYEPDHRELQQKHISAFEKNIKERIFELIGKHRFDMRYGRYYLEPGEQDIDAILEKVNLAHRIAKTQKSTSVCEYDELFKQNVVKELELESKMEDALKNNEFVVYLQPKYLLDDETIVGAEALVRWQPKGEALIPPNVFIPLFEKNGFVTKLDFYMLNKVSQIIRGWMDDGKPLVPISVNFSRLHLLNDHFVEEIEETVGRYAIPRNHIEVELTESTIFENEEILIKILNELHNAGFSLSMDDFGTGYSSLGLLKNLPVDVIKIDKTFFSDSEYKTRAWTIIGSIMEMAKKLGMRTVAEGVETQENIDFLRAVGCDIVQGFYYAKPIPAEDFHISSPARSLIEKKPEEVFSFSEIGDIEAGRKTLGSDMPVSVYRLFQYTMRRVLSQKYGEGEMLEIFRKAGKMAGVSFSKSQLDTKLPLIDFIEQLKSRLLALKIGILNVESINEKNGDMVITISDDLDCSGTTFVGKSICQYDEGLIMGILYEYTGRNYLVIEIDCAGTGSDICRFTVRPN